MLELPKVAMSDQSRLNIVVRVEPFSIVIVCEVLHIYIFRTF